MARPLEKEHGWYQSRETLPISNSEDMGILPFQKKKLCPTFNILPRKFLKSSGYDIFHPWRAIREHQYSITPDIKPLKEPYTGVAFSFKDAMEITAKRILSLPDVQNKSPNLKLNIKFGFDGSGSHSIYNQSNNQQTHNIILTMFCPLNLVSSNGITLWEQQSPNNPLSHRPLQLQMGKESGEAIETLAEFNADMCLLKEEGMVLTNEEQNVNLTVDIKSHMMDNGHDSRPFVPWPWWCLL